jgi:hypothetical protein
MSFDTIYVYLLDEGTDVWRPVQAERLADGRYRLLGFMPDDECWEFPSGSVVRVRLKMLSGGNELVAERDNELLAG